MKLKLKICRLYSTSYVPTKDCCDGYCEDDLLDYNYQDKGGKPN